MYGRVSFRPCRIPRGRISAIWWPPRYPAPAQASGESWKFYAVYTASGSSCWPSLPVTARSSCPRVNAQPLTGIAAIGWPPPTRILRSTSNTCGSFVRRAKSKTVTGICRSATGFDVTSAYHFQNQTRARKSRQNRPRRLRTSARQTENRERKSAFNGQKRPKPLSGVRKAVWKSLYFPAFERGIEKGRGKSALKEMVGRMSIIANFSLQRLGTFWGCEGNQRKKRNIMIGPFQSLFLYRFIWNSFLFGNMQVFMLDSAQTVCLRFRIRPSLLSQLEDSNMFFVLLIKQRNVYRRAYFERPIV